MNSLDWWQNLLGEIIASIAVMTVVLEQDAAILAGKPTG
jgi:hypothetical protein